MYNLLTSLVWGRQPYLSDTHLRKHWYLSLEVLPPAHFRMLRIPSEELQL